MSIVPNAGYGQLTTLASPEVLRAAAQFGRLAANLYNNLPNIKKEKNQFRSGFERKMGSVSTVSGSKNVRNKLVDVSNASSNGPQAQRSFSGSYALGVSNNGGKKGKGGSGGKGGGRKMSVPRSPYMDKIAVCFRASITINNTGLNVSNVNVTLGHSTPLGIAQLNTYVTQMTALATIFREFRIRRMELSFVPRLGSTAAGVFSACIDRDCRAGLVSGTSTIIRKDPFLECDIKQSANLTWRPTDEEDHRWRYTQDASRPQEFQSQGMLLWYSANDQASGATIGELFADIWYEYAIPY